MEKERLEANKKSDAEVFEERLFNRDIIQKIAEEMKPTIQDYFEENAPSLIQESDAVLRLQEEIERVKEMGPRQASSYSE